VGVDFNTDSTQIRRRPLSNAASFHRSLHLDATGSFTLAEIDSGQFSVFLPEDLCKPAALSYSLQTSVTDVRQHQQLYIEAREQIAVLTCERITFSEIKAHVHGIDVLEKVGSLYLPPHTLSDCAWLLGIALGAVELEIWWKGTLGLLRGSSHSMFPRLECDDRVLRQPQSDL
jgi:hypothetical protein